MKRLQQTGLLLVLCGFCLTACNSSGGGKKKKSNQPTSESHEPVNPDDHWEGYAEHYMEKEDRNGNFVYDYELEKTEGEELRKNIHHYLIDQHRTYLHYNQITGMYRHTDIPDGQTKYEMFYTGNLSTSNTTREHIWCCANSNNMWYRNSSKQEWRMDDGGGPENYWGGGSDIYQLRPCDYDVNSARSNYRYTVFTDSNYSEATDGGPYKLKYNESKKTCEVADYFKGDVARTLMYIYMHYNAMDNYDVYYSNDYTPTYNPSEAIPESSTHSPYVCGSLNFTFIMSYSSEDACISKLKAWNKLDPVSDLERKRNDVVETYFQGNRNPFVDYPELVDKCFPNIL